MGLLFVRHAIAILAPPGIPDKERPLGPEEHQRFDKTSRMLAHTARKP